jgi:prepilin-type N-terminal cleavage/methylation domain-containing protein
MIKKQRESGFTLIELMTVSSIILILAKLSIANYESIKQTVYEKSLDSTLHDAKTAIEAGKGNFTESNMNWLSLWTDGDGNMHAFAGGPDGGGEVPAGQIVPGINVGHDTRLNLFVSSWCEETTLDWCGPGDPCCVVESIQAQQCKAHLLKRQMRWKNGEIWEFESVMPDC